jgi:predicted HTH domain antitoxin
MLHNLTIEYGDDLLLNLSVSPEQFAQEAKFLLAAKLYELGRLSAGQAAAFAGQERVEFLFALQKIHLPMSNLTFDELETELNFARNG